MQHHRRGSTIQRQMVEFLNDEKEDRETPLCSFLFYLCLFVFLSCCPPSPFHSIYQFLYLTNFCVSASSSSPRLSSLSLAAWPSRSSSSFSSTSTPSSSQPVLLVIRRRRRRPLPCPFQSYLRSVQSESPWRIPSSISSAGFVGAFVREDRRKRG